jgi:hypothetical protein
VHGDKYDYSQATYVNGRKHITVVCRRHGAFYPSPLNHINRASGCPACADELWAIAQRMDWEERAKGRSAQLYFLRFYSETEVFYKVGITYLGVSKRFQTSKQVRGYSYEVLALHTSQNAAAVYDWEQSILETFAHLKYTPKKSFGGSTECFSSCDEILAIFPL